MGLLASGQTMLSQVMDSEGVPITYARGATGLPFTATPDTPDYMVVNSAGQLITSGERDWNFDLVNLGSLNLPIRGDQVSQVIAGVTYLWNVLPNGNGRVFDWLDSRRSRISVHTVFGSVVS